MAVASLRYDHNWQRASRDPQVVGCCHSGSGQPISYEDDRDGDAISCFVVGLEMGYLAVECPVSRDVIIIIIRL